jgi:hypothetical protein
MINKLISNPFVLLMGLISLVMVSDDEIAAYIVAGFAEGTGNTFISSVILYFMNLWGDITLFLFNALIELVIWITVFAVIASALMKRR